jgi:hypothetical protein
MSPVHRFGPKPGLAIPAAGRPQVPAAPGQALPAAAVAPAPNARPAVPLPAREGTLRASPATAAQVAAITPPPSPSGGPRVPVPRFSPSRAG